jgi:hypothetical protein
MTATTKLKVAKAGEPPRKLGAHGGALWRAVMAEYQIEDSAGLAMLAQACIALDRAEQCRAAIEKDGVVIRARAGPPKDHPALKHELGFRSFTVRTLQKLGLDVEPLRSHPGRPPGGFGIRGFTDD